MGATNDEISEAAGFVIIAPGADGGGGGGGIPGGGGGSGGGGMPTTAGGGTPGGSGGGGRKGGGGLFMILIFIQHFLLSSILKCILSNTITSPQFYPPRASCICSRGWYSNSVVSCMDYYTAAGLQTQIFQLIRIRVADSRQTPPLLHFFRTT